MIDQQGRTVSIWLIFVEIDDFEERFAVLLRLLLAAARYLHCHGCGLAAGVDGDFERACCVGFKVIDAGGQIDLGIRHVDLHVNGDTGFLIICVGGGIHR